MKKLFTILLCTILVCSLCACGDEDAPAVSSVTASEPQELIEEEYEETYEAPVEADVEAEAEVEEITEDTHNSTLVFLEESSDYIHLVGLDPETEEEYELAYFPLKLVVTGDYPLFSRYDVGDAYKDIYSWSPDFQLYAGAILYPNSEWHAAWIDQSGNITDVTELLGEAGGNGFSDKPVDFVGMGFTKDDRFVFCDRENGVYWTVPTSDISQSAKTEVSKEELSPYFDDLGLDDATDWIDQTHCIVTRKAGTELEWKSYIRDMENGTKTDYIPDTDRINYAGRISPDAVHVAFMSSLSYYGQPQIFIGTLNGDEPTEVTTTLPLAAPQRPGVPSAEGCYTLMDWVE